VLWVAIPFTLFPFAQQHVSSAVAGMLNGGVPLVAAVFGALMLRALPGRAQLVGLALGFIGILMISLPELGQDASGTLGVAMIFVAVLCYGLALVIATPAHQRYGPLPVTARMLGIAAVLTAPLGLASVGSSSFSWKALLATSALGILGTGLAFLIIGGLAASVGSMRASFVTYLIPVVATILGIVILNEDVAAAAIVGVALVIAGAALASRRERVVDRTGERMDGGR
jgi:drug/metabolite transporter (DMT)-like permease